MATVAGCFCSGTLRCRSKVFAPVTPKSKSMHACFKTFQGVTYTHSIIAVSNCNLTNHLQSCAANLSTFGRKIIAIHNKPVKSPGGCIGERKKL